MQGIAVCSHEKTAALFKAAVLRDPAGARTQDPNIKSVVLYQLSYGISDTKRGVSRFWWCKCIEYFCFTKIKRYFCRRLSEKIQF